MGCNSLRRDRAASNVLQQSTRAMLAAGKSQTQASASVLTICLTCLLPPSAVVCLHTCLHWRTRTALHAAPPTSARCLRRSLRQNRRAARRRRSARAARSGSASRRTCRPRRAVLRSLARCASSRRCGGLVSHSPCFHRHPQWDGAQVIRLGAEPWMYECGQISMLKHAAKQTCSLARHGRMCNSKGARLLLARAHPKS